MMIWSDWFCLISTCNVNVSQKFNCTIFKPVTFLEVLSLADTKCMGIYTLMTVGTDTVCVVMVSAHP